MGGVRIPGRTCISVAITTVVIGDFRKSEHPHSVIDRVEQKTVLDKKARFLLAESLIDFLRALNPFRRDVVDVVQTINEHDLIKLVASADQLLQESQLVAAIKSELGHDMDLPIRMLTADPIRETIFHI